VAQLTLESNDEGQEQKVRVPGHVNRQRETGDKEYDEGQRKVESTQDGTSAHGLQCRFHRWGSIYEYIMTIVQIMGTASDAYGKHHSMRTSGQHGCHIWSARLYAVTAKVTRTTNVSVLQGLSVFHDENLLITIFMSSLQQCRRNLQLTTSWRPWISKQWYGIVREEVLDTSARSLEALQVELHATSRKARDTKTIAKSFLHYLL